MARIPTVTQPTPLRRLVRRPHRVSRATWLVLFAIGLASWRAATAASVPDFLVSLLLWALALVTAYWIVVMWSIVFSIRADADGSPPRPARDGRGAEGGSR